MRIQHNIMAMNAYRNFTNNTSALSKNLEKLSSGYKINRAGDDAAGLAISEKMRAQISGLEQAQKNAKSGINLVQTAEGSLTEVHDMLNRMVTLAEQSANGTYDDGVDRANLQKEFDQLRSEIDRIADSSNFNGINLLDGSLSAEGKAGAATTVEADLSKLGLDITLGAKEIKATSGKFTTANLLEGTTSKQAVAASDSFTFELTFTDAKGKEQTITKTLKFGTGGVNDTNDNFYLDDGTENGKKLAATIGVTNGVTKAKIAEALEEALMSDDLFRANFTASAAAAGTLEFTARVPGTGGPVVKDAVLSYKDGAADPKVYERKLTTVAAEDATKGYDMTKAAAWDGKADTLEDAIFEINGKKFVFLKNTTDDTDAAVQKSLREAGVEHWITAGGGTVDATDIKAMLTKIQTATGLDVKQGAIDNQGKFVEKSTGTGTFLVFSAGTSSADDAKGGGLTLQIGDTSDSFNQLTVSVSDMHAKALGIADITIGDQKGAQAAVQTIKDAINKVSSTRGDLGALQNRLDHTINNLSVMQENIQDAEATIRDTDVAEEMMAYTKNNILVQSAQAMLAQANQVPQGVLQLLQ